MLQFNGIISGCNSDGFDSWGGTYEIDWTRPCPSVHLIGLDGGVQGGWPDTYPSGVSAGGLAVAGSSGTNADSKAWRWSEPNGTVDLGFLGASGATRHSVVAGGISADGALVAGTSSYWIGLDGTSQAFWWTQTSGMQPLGDMGVCNGISADGTTYLGTSVGGSGGAWRMTASGAEYLGTLNSDPHADNGEAYASSASGAVVTGWSRGDDNLDHAFRWTADGGMIQIGPVGVESIGLGVSADGSAVTGYASYADGTRPFRWTAGGGFQDIGTPNETQYARAISGDGSVVGGDRYPTGSPGLAFIWTPTTGMIDLHDYLAAQDVDVSRWVFNGATAISPDGTAIAGWGYGSDGTGGSYPAWLVRGLSLACVNIGTQPSAQTACPNGAASFAVSAAGNGPLTYQWQWRTGPGQAWLNISEGANPNPITGAFIFSAAGAQGVGLEVLDNQLQGAPDVQADFRCVVTAPCGHVNSNAAALTLRLCSCNPDFNGDGAVGTDADIEAFFACLGGNCCPTCGSADFNGDGAIGTDADIESFFRVLGGGPC
jgi:probable HAF family extracellular repeat protein